MKQTIFMEKYPIFTLEIGKDECSYKDVNEIIEYFKSKIKSDKIASYIGEFDHYAHTSALEDGEIAADIKDAKLVVFCFGPKLPNAQMLAVRPRSIGVCEKEGCFVISFLEAPMPAINQKIKEWAKGLIG